MIWGIIIVLIVLLDQLTKYWVISSIDFGGRVAVIDGFFYIAHWTNKGAAWGIMQNGRLFFIPMTLLVSILLIYFIRKYDNKVLRTAISFILGGAVGNLIDRIFRGGGVIDFLDFDFGFYHYPTFNTADSFVVLGTIILAYYMLFMHKDNEKIQSES